MTADMDADTGSGSGGGTVEARFKTIGEEQAKVRREMGTISTAVTEINANVTAGVQQLFQGYSSRHCREWLRFLRESKELMRAFR